MIKNLKAKIKQAVGNEKGEFYLDTMIAIFVLLIVLAVMISIFPVLNQKQKLNSFTTSVARAMELQGTTNIPNDIAYFKEKFGLKPEMKFSHNGNIPLGETFYVESTLSSSVGIGSFVKIPITIRSRGTGRGEMYWKN